MFLFIPLIFKILHSSKTGPVCEEAQLQPSLEWLSSTLLSEDTEKKLYQKSHKPLQ